jgi:hypothetical protein
MVLSEGHQPIPYGVADLVRLGDVLLSRRHVRGVGKSMNFAGVPAIRETRYRIRSRGLVFLALAILSPARPSRRDPDSKPPREDSNPQESPR